MPMNKVRRKLKYNINNVHFQSEKLRQGRAALIDSESSDSEDIQNSNTRAFGHYLHDLYRSVKFQQQEYKSGSTKVIGKLAEDLVKFRIAKKLRWACTTEVTDNAPIDIFAVTCQPPYKIALIQVKSAFDSRSVYINPDYLKSNRGPIWIIVATVDLSKSKKDINTSDDDIDELEGMEAQGMGYTFLIFTHRELKKFIDDYRKFYGPKEDPQYAFSIPTRLRRTRFERFQDAWWKIEKNSRLYA